MKKTLISVLLIIASMAFFTGCGGGGGESGIASATGDVQRGSIKGQLEGDQVAGLTVIAEPVKDGMTASVRKAFLPKRLTAEDKIYYGISDEEGNYEIENVEVGPYYVSAKKGNTTVGSAKQVAVRQNAVSQVDIQITPTGNISGDVDLMGYLDDAGVLVFLEGTSYMAVTASDGTFTITDVPAVAGTTYTLKIQAYGFESYASAALTVTGSQTLALGQIALNPLSAGPSGNIDGYVDDGTNPIGSVEVEFWLGNEMFGLVRTDASGYFSIIGLPVATWNVVYDKYGFEDMSVNVNVTNGTTEEASVSLVPYSTPNISFEGYVYTHGDPLPGALVEVLDGGLLLVSDTTDAFGKFQIATVPMGTWTVKASKTDFADVSKTHYFGNEPMENEDFHLQPTLDSLDLSPRVTSIPIPAELGGQKYLNNLVDRVYTNHARKPLNSNLVTSWSVVSGPGSIADSYYYQSDNTPGTVEVSCDYTENNITKSLNLDLLVEYFTYIRAISGPEALYHYGVINQQSMATTYSPDFTNISKVVQSPGFVYMCNDNNLDGFDTDTFTQLWSYAYPGSGYDDVAVTPDGSTVVGVDAGGYVQFVDGFTGSDLGQPTIEAGADMCAVNDTYGCFVKFGNPGVLSIMPLASPASKVTLEVTMFPSDVAVDPLANVALVPQEDQVEVVDLTTPVVSGTITLSENIGDENPSHIIASPLGQYFYIFVPDAGYGAYMAVLDSVGNSVVNTIAFSPNSVSEMYITKCGAKLYIHDDGDGVIHVFDVSVVGSEVYENMVYIGSSPN